MNELAVLVGHPARSNGWLRCLRRQAPATWPHLSWQCKCAHITGDRRGHRRPCATWELFSTKDRLRHVRRSQPGSRLRRHRWTPAACWGPLDASKAAREPEMRCVWFLRLTVLGVIATPNAGTAIVRQNRTAKSTQAPAALLFQTSWSLLWQLRLQVFVSCIHAATARF